ncbi:hypothetical protein BWQ96_06024 [Gracilariopsis chorda]|uniref:Uncharacterized protein n=1 Tax=Gracilariopsis chorda TaxID=448386 RepID=A0A2V3IQA1_9FLOR|nr:hypothetical protein BWQ96_06024 [Gracilariopsis chorda]|eukprot:PXF44243.1 hypothetical protein BWQ96_06024 [Gracilariopsis chorda]
MRFSCRLCAVFFVALSVAAAYASLLPPSASLPRDDPTAAAQASSSRAPRRSVRQARVAVASSSKQPPQLAVANRPAPAQVPAVRRLAPNAQLVKPLHKQSAVSREAAYQRERLQRPLTRKASTKSHAHAKNKKPTSAHKSATKPKPLTGGEIHRRRRGAPDQGVLVDKSYEAPWYSFSFHKPDGGLHYNNGNGYLLGYQYRDGHRYRNRPRPGNSYENREDFHYKDGNYYAYF